MTKKIFYFLSALMVIMLQFGCSKSGQLTATCTDIGSFESKMGIINVPQFQLGTVLLLDTVNNTAGYLGKLNFSINDISLSTKRDSMVMLSDAKFKTTFSGDFAQASEDVKAEASTSINNQTAFFLSNSVRKDLLNTTALLQGIAKKDKDAYQDALTINRGTIIAVVHSVTYADKFEFRSAASTGADASANILKIGKYNVSVNYSCQNSLSVNAKQDGIFYKVTNFVLKDGEFKLRLLNIKMNEYRVNENAFK